MSNYLELKFKKQILVKFCIACFKSLIRSVLKCQRKTHLRRSSSCCKNYLPMCFLGLWLLIQNTKQLHTHLSRDQSAYANETHQFGILKVLSWEKPAVLGQHLSLKRVILFPPWMTWHLLLQRCVKLLMVWDDPGNARGAVSEEWIDEKHRKLPNLTKKNLSYVLPKLESAFNLLLRCNDVSLEELYFISSSASGLILKAIFTAML